MTNWFLGAIIIVSAVMILSVSIIWLDKKRKLKRWHWVIAVILFVQIFRLPIGGRTMMPPDERASAAGAPMYIESYSRGVIPQWNPYMLGGMPIAFRPRIIKAAMVMIRAPKLVIKYAHYFELAIVGLLLYILLRKHDRPKRS